MMNALKNVALGMLLCGALPALADGDSSSDLSGGFVQQVLAAPGVVLKVPVDRDGNELAGAAELRLVSDTSTSADLATVFAAGRDASVGAVLTAADLARDSSTSGRGWNGWNNGGWNNGGRDGGGWNNGPSYGGWQSNYYASYQPTYYNYGNSFRYGYQGYSDYWSGDRYDNDYGRGYGYRYYSYGRCF